MDVAYYLSELLGQIGEVNVPGLGFFAQTRLDGYYNNQDATFYPPGHKIDFDQQFIDDDVLAKYIAQKKNISLASSKYFTEKYINGLKQEALLKDVPLADLGWLYMEQSKVIFKPAEALTADPSFYGFPPIKLEKTGGTTYVEPIPEPKPEPVPMVFPETVVPENAVPDPFLYEHVPVIEETVKEISREPEPYIPPVIPEPVKEEIVGAAPVLPAPVYVPEPPAAVMPLAPVYVLAPVAHEPQFFPEVSTGPLTDTKEEFIFRGRGHDVVEEKKRNWWGIILIGIGVILLIVILGIVALYEFKRDTFNRMSGVIPKPVELVQPPKTDTLKTAIPVVKADTDKKDTTKKIAPADTGKKAVAVPVNSPGAVVIDTASVVHYEIMGGSFKTVTEANKSISNYKSIGIEAHLLTGPGTGQRKKLSLGTYFSRQEANENLQKLKGSGKVQSDIYVQQINPKQ